MARPKRKPTAGLVSAPAMTITNTRDDIYPAVHISVAKRKGTNAVRVAEAVHERLGELSQTHFPDGVHYRITRDYGETANDKVNELVEGLVIAVITVIGLIGLVMGWRPALVIALAIPVCYSLTLFVNLLAGYTINRVTMFALILALGLLVDDPITDVENIARYFTMKVLPPRQSVLRAVQEVRPALILSTLAIIASFLPLAFITGMMGPYMAPMALNVPLTVTISTVVAFLITPWLAMVALRGITDTDASAGEKAFDLSTRPLYRLSRAVLTPILNHTLIAWGVLFGIALLLVAAMILPGLPSRPGQDASVRQQERVSDCHRHARKHDARTHRRRRSTDWAVSGRSLGSPRLRRVCRQRVADGLQRTGPALLSCVEDHTSPIFG